MRSFPHFQTLPEFIVEKILGYLLDENTRHSGDTDKCSPLLYICTLWRSLFIKEAFTNLDIVLEYKKPIRIEYPKWPKHAAIPQYPINNLVKSVNIYYHGWMATDSNHNVDLFKSVFLENQNFLSTHSIYLIITLDRNYETSSTLDKLDMLFSYFWQLIPNIKKISIDCKLTDFFYTDDYSLFFSQRLFAKAKGIPDVTVVNFEGTSMDTSDFINGFTGLTSFNYSWTGHSDAFNHVVRRNAKTLKVLYATCKRQQNIESIFFNGDLPIVYPSLETLSIFFSKSDARFDKSSRTNHLPALKRLYLVGRNGNRPEFLFNNREMNFDLLEFLQVTDSAGFFNSAYDYNVFSSGQLKRLQTAIFHIDDDGSNRAIAYDKQTIGKSSIRLVALVMDTSRDLCRLKIDGSIDAMYFATLLEVPSRFANLQELKIPNIHMFFSDILLLMRLAPFLCLLDTSLKDDYPSVSGAEPDDLVRYMEDNCVDLGKNMTYLYLTCAGTTTRSMNKRNYCISLTLLASICPKTICIFTQSFGIEAVRSELLQIFQTKELSKYADRYLSLAKKLKKPALKSYFGF